jgi:hypothetical protein
VGRAVATRRVGAFCATEEQLSPCRGRASPGLAPFLASGQCLCSVQPALGRKTDAEKALVLIEAQISAGNWTNPERGKVKLEDYAATWITQRPGLRPRTVDLYRWLLKKHIAPYIGSVAAGKLSAALVREWRAKLLANGVSVSMAAKAYRLLRAIMTTAVDDDGLLSRNPCRIKGASDEHAGERPVLTPGQVYDLAGRVGIRPVGNIRATRTGSGYGSPGMA